MSRHDCCHLTLPERDAHHNPLTISPLLAADCVIRSMGDRVGRGGALCALQIKKQQTVTGLETLVLDVHGVLVNFFNQGIQAGVPEVEIYLWGAPDRTGRQPDDQLLQFAVFADPAHLSTVKGRVSVPLQKITPAVLGALSSMYSVAFDDDLHHATYLTKSLTTMGRVFRDANHILIEKAEQRLHSLLAQNPQPAGPARADKWREVLWTSTKTVVGSTLRVGYLVTSFVAACEVWTNPGLRQFFSTAVLHGVQSHLRQHVPAQLQPSWDDAMAQVFQGNNATATVCVGGDVGSTVLHIVIIGNPAATAALAAVWGNVQKLAQISGLRFGGAGEEISTTIIDWYMESSGEIGIAALLLLMDEAIEANCKDFGRESPWTERADDLRRRLLGFSFEKARGTIPIICGCMFCT